MSETAYYVYGVVPGASAVAASPPVELVAQGALAAVVERVRVAELAPDADALVERALAHQAVLARLLDEGLPVVPFRFATLYAAAADVESLLRRREPELLAAVEAVEGRVELGVKLRVDAAEPAVAARDERIERLERELASAGPGAAHLRRKQLERMRAEAIAAERRRRASELHETLAAAAAAATAGPLPEGDEDVVLNGAYLVERAEEDRFRALAARAGGAGVEVTGPWPAYSFVGSELDD